MIGGITGRIRYRWRRSRPRPEVVAAVELGSSTIRVLVGEQAGTQVTLIGYGEAPARGMRRGVIMDAPSMSEALGDALFEASCSAEVCLQRAVLSVSGHHVDGFRNEARVRVSSPGGSASGADIAHAIALSKAKTLPRGRCVIHHLTGGIEAAATMSAPVGCADTGGCWQVSTWHVHGDQARISDVLLQMQSLGLRVEQVVLAGLASGAVATTFRERESGVLLLDYGAGTVDYALYRRGHAIHAGVLAVGGAHVANDLSIALRLRHDDAEAIQRRHGRAQVRLRPDNDERVWLDDRRGVGARTLPLRTIELVCAARVRETLEIVRRKLGDDYRPEHVPAGVVVTGGMAEMEGLIDVTANVFGARAKAGAPDQESGPQLAKPCYSTVLGTMRVGCELQAQEPKRHPPNMLRRMLRATDYVLRPGDRDCELP